MTRAKGGGRRTSTQERGRDGEHTRVELASNHGVHGGTRQAKPGHGGATAPPHHGSTATAAPSRQELWEPRDHADPVTLAMAKKIEDERERRLLQIDADGKDRRRMAVRLRPMARAMAAGVRRNRPATVRATQVAREKGD